MNLKKLLSTLAVVAVFSIVLSNTASAQRFGGHGYRHGGGFSFSFGGCYPSYSSCYTYPVYSPCYTYPVYTAPCYPVYRPYYRQCW